MKQKKKIVMIAAGVALLLGGYFVYEHIAYVTTDNAQIEAHAVLLAAKVSGYVNKVNVVEGQKVKRGDVVAEIDDRDYQNLLTQVKAELTSIEARKRDAERNFHRLSELNKSGAVSQQQYDTSFTAYSEVKAKFDSISAQVNQAQLNVEYTKIKAPSDGYIAKTSVEIGQFASPGVPLVGFVDAEERWVTANFKETDIESIKPNHKVDVEVDAISGRKFKGTVLSLSAATGATFTLLPPDNATGNFTKVVQRVAVKIRLDELSPQDIEVLRSGLSAIVSVHKH